MTETPFYWEEATYQPFEQAEMVKAGTNRRFGVFWRALSKILVMYPDTESGSIARAALEESDGT